MDVNRSPLRLCRHFDFLYATFRLVVATLFIINHVVIQNTKGHFTIYMKTISGLNHLENAVMLKATLHVKCPCMVGG